MSEYTGNPTLPLPDGDSAAHVDEREQLYNEQETGPITEVQLPAERIVVLHGVLFDLDPKLYRPGNGIFEPAETPEAFYKGIQPVLDRHPLACKAEVRVSGTGLHLILWISPAVELEAVREQERWDTIVKVLQRTLPIDPGMPGITALTRPVGSVNTKNKGVVSILASGQPVSKGAVEDYLVSLRQQPYRIVVRQLLGAEKITPCPFCQKNKAFSAFDWIGKCYGCGKVTLAQVFDHIYAAPTL